MRVLLLDLDTLRPDHLGCYGYHRNTSPNIDRVASEGVRFENYYCSDAPCLPSRAALMTGRFGIHTGVVNHGGQCADLRPVGPERIWRDQCGFENLPYVMRQSGMKTALVSPFAERHAAWWFYAGFNEMFNTGRGGAESAEEITPTVKKWLEENAEDDNWYLHVNYWDPHTNFRAPEEFGNPFENEPVADWITEEVLEKHKKMVGPHSALEVNMWDDSPNTKYPRHVSAIRTMEDLKRHYDGYDCGIAYMDQHIGQLLDTLEQKGVLEETAIIITADHGENHGELGLYAEHATADAITCRLPMVIKWPGGKKGTVDKGLHYNLDLIPTFAELFGKERQSGWDGKSYAPSILKGEENGREYLVISQCAHVCQRGVRWDSWLYMRTYHDGFHLFPREMLFNLDEDPYEQNDLAGKRPDLCAQGARFLLEWQDDMMMSMPDNYETDPLWTVMKEHGPFHAKGMLKKYCERLKETGREYAIPELKKRHPWEFADK